MCLVKVRQEEDVVVPYRVVQHSHSPSRRHSQSTRRISRTEVIRESPRPSASYVAVPAPKPLAIPTPQPVPVFVEPHPAPPPPPSVHSHAHTHGAHYVEVSPRSSLSSMSDRRSRSDYVVHEREYRRRERDYSPASSSPRYEHFRYVEPPPSESDHFERYERRRSRSRVRERSLSRGRGGGWGDEGRRSYGGRDYGERVTRERITIVDDDGVRRREYRR